MRIIYITFLFILLGFTASAQKQAPNIILIIADDLGSDMLEGYGIGGPKPYTPTLDSLRQSGITFTNCWAAPQCTPTRAAIVSGKYGIKTGVMRPPGPLDIEHTSIFKRIREESNTDYDMSVIGKWHIGGNSNLEHPAQTGVDHYEGFLSGFVDDYFEWEKVTNGTAEAVSEYVTTNFTDAAIGRVSGQTEPWFLWLAHAAPHGPLHTPPSGLFTTEITDDRSQYFAMIEAMDAETKRLLNSLYAETLANTIIFFIGDNGTPNGLSEYYPAGHAKGSIYEGGLRVPMFVTGKDVGRVGEIEDGLLQVTDIHATILELVGVQLPGGINNSLSFKPLLECGGQTLRTINYIDYIDNGTLVWATRTDQYKLLEDENGNQEFYDIISDLKEENNLIDNLTAEQEEIRDLLAAEAIVIRNDWSCNDGIQNGEETTIDDCDSTCDDIDELSTENIGCCEEPSNPSVFYEFAEGDMRHIYSNTYPNHDFCYGNTLPNPNYRLYRVDLEPQFSGEITNVVRANGMPGRFFGVAKNSVFLMPAPGLPFVFENTDTGEYNWDWVFEPTTNQGSGQGKVSLDCSSAHANESNGYHYHGNMFEYLETIEPGSSTTIEIPEEPIHIGWASDGFPILYRFGPDEEGNMKELLPSYQLKSGLRPGDGISEPCGPYSGKYTADYEYICGKGDLGQCNGMESEITITTSQGEEIFDFFYVITSDFPQLPRCMLGTVSDDFRSSSPSLEGEDLDGDGFINEYDCDDEDPAINPLAEEILGNDVDENCDGIITSSTDLATLGFSVYPNPNKGNFWLSTPSGNEFTVKLFTTDGKFVRSIIGNENIHFEDIRAGSYAIEVYSSGALIGSTKVIVL